MYTLMWELAQDRQRTLLREAAAERLARAASGGRRRARFESARRAAGGWLIALGSRVAGSAAAGGYGRPVAGQGAR
jgi:hypothetical protein